MTFLNAALAFGAAAFAIPLVIHLLNRRRFRTVEWGAMHLLESVVRTNHRRFRLDRWLLLLVRCAIPVLLALCLARPVLTSILFGGTGGLRGDAPVSLVILLDDSYSMDAAAGEARRFDTALSAASELVAAAARGADVAVIRTGGRPAPLLPGPVFDRAAVRRRLADVAPTHGPADTAAALDAALATLAGMSHADRELVVLSDFQPADWAWADGDAANTLRRRVEAAEFPPALTLIRTAGPLPTAVNPSTAPNLSVDAVRFPDRTPGVGQSLAVRAVVRNHGDAAVDGARVAFRVDGAEAGVSSVALPADGTAQVLFPHAFDTPGPHRLEVAVSHPGDPLPADDAYRAVVDVSDPVPVLLVDGAPGRGPLEGETDYLAVALTPFTFGRERPADLFETRTVPVDRFTPDLLPDARLVVLANVPRLSDEQLAALTEWVTGGGAVLVTAGDRLDLAWHRDRLHDGGDGLLPAAWGESAGGESGERDDRTARVVAGRFEHPALAYFNDPGRGDPSAATVRRWYRLEMNGGGAEANRPVVAARLDTGDPLLVERRFGKGTVLQWATTVDADWTDLPLQPVFVPLVQQLVTAAATRTAPPRNVAAGDPIVTPLPDGADADGTVAVETPDGRRRTATVSVEGDARFARFDDTREPGFYAMTLPGASAEVVRFAAETDRGESDLATMNGERLAALAERLGAERVESAADYLARDDLRRHGREVWKWLLAGLLACLFLELVLQQRFSGVARPALPPPSSNPTFKTGGTR